MPVHSDKNVHSNTALTRHILDEAEAEESAAKKSALIGRLHRAQKEVLRVKDGLAAANETIAASAMGLAAAKDAVSEAKQIAQRLVNELSLMETLEVDLRKTYKEAKEQVKSISKADKSARLRAKVAREDAKSAAEKAAARRSALRGESCNAKQVVHACERKLYPFGLQEARAQAQKASLAIQQADTENVLKSVMRDIDMFNSTHRKCSFIVVSRLFC